jgi:hypothetical protein
MMRRGSLLLVSGLAAVALAPHAAADPTATTPAPDPNPPPGAAPDPYSPPPKTAPAPPVHVASHVYTPPVVRTPVHAAPTRTSERTYTPRPARHSHVAVTHRPRKRVRPARHHRRVVAHKPKHVVVRLTPRLDAYIALVGKTMSAAVAPADDGAVAHRRRAAGLALVVLCLASTSLILLGRRRLRERIS